MLKFRNFEALLKSAGCLVFELWLDIYIYIYHYRYVVLGTVSHCFTRNLRLEHGRPLVSSAEVTLLTGEDPWQRKCG